MDFKNITMKNIAIIIFTLFHFGKSMAQTPTLKIDGQEYNVSSDISFPLWVSSGKSVALGNSLSMISIIEFNSSTDLTFSKVINLVSAGTVPSGKTWKIESVCIKNINSGTLSTLPKAVKTSPVITSSNGFFIIPPGVYQIAIEMWGAGGDGFPGSSSPVKYGQGGASGGYGYEVFNVNPGDTIFHKLGKIDTALVWGIGFQRYATRGGSGQGYVYSNNTWTNQPISKGGITNLAYTEQGADNKSQSVTGMGAPYGGGLSGSNSGVANNGTAPGGGGGGGISTTNYGTGGVARIHFHF